MKDIHEISLLMDFYGQILPAKQLSIMELHYGSDLTLSEIAEQTGITRQGVHDHIMKAERKLNAMEDKMKLVERSKMLKVGISKLIELIENGLSEDAVTILKGMLQEDGSF